ncbi:MAG: signal peptidase I [Clostridia bacterium]|nr:signal peptidase I [Clostridia bacterium]
MATETKQKKSAGVKVTTIIGIVLCVIFGTMLVCNIAIIVQGVVNPDRPPAIFGVTPMGVLSGSMSGTAPDHIEKGDLVFTFPCDTNELKVGDVITFMEDGAVVTHRIIELVEEEGVTKFQTKGDANNTQDRYPIHPNDVIGKYKFRIPKLGEFADFMKEPLGMAIFIGIPLFAFIVSDIIRRNRTNTKANKQTQALEEELERLRKLAGEAPDEGANQETKEEAEAPAPEVTD